MKILSRILGPIVCLVAMGSNPALAQNTGNTDSSTNPPTDARATQEARQAADLDLDQLANMDVKVTSASKKEESLSGAPAAIYVLTGEDIRRGGFTTLPEALRMVPGLYVAQTNSHAWQISTRGFNGINNNKMLLLVDGRSAYTPDFGGVYWDMQDIPLEDIDRIEVIRGPGGTLWGANAVNGVINVITKSSDRTLGMMISSSLDMDTGYTTTLQYGGQIGTGVTYRAYGKASYWLPPASPSGSRLSDSFGLPQAGMRLDWAISPKDTLTVEGMALDGRFQGAQFLSPVVESDLIKDDNVQVRWKHIISNRSSIEAFAYCDWFARQGFPPERRNTCDLEFQHSFAFNPRNSLIWGGAFLTTADHVPFYTPQYRRARVESGFLQYEYVVSPEHLRILAGSKFEGNQFSGIEYQPQARIVWTPGKAHTLWAAVSRAVRDPARSESDLDSVVGVDFSQSPPVITSIVGNPHLQSEHLRAYELGYRWQPNSSFWLDLATYYNSYTNLIVVGNPIVQILPGEIAITLPYVNGTPALAGTAQTHGAELSAKWRPLRRWLLSPSVTEMRGSANAVLGAPAHLFQVQSRLDLPHGINFDGGLYHYNALPAQAAGAAGATPGIPTFNRVDLGLSWNVTKQWMVGVWGRNLQSDKHLETGSDFFGGTAGEIPRSVVFKLMWQSNAESTRSY